ncbi:cysteine desulfurase family protein [Candidatus Fokinia crypta]|uniref:Cysteine desulfurase n=1 Tax=Candidatus Fokinia crypta TaxID=1920990 RepID=A0ABZ0USX6_9RICK|nr:cysteine desulfurase family protein [Candidatus Fokinia cryptica]WPX98025.1 Cysteine desulfurase [Candidatus Fokinia cryptica]
MIYLDHNATTYLDEDVLAFLRKIEGKPQNASSTHSYGEDAKRKLNSARTNILEALECDQKLYNVIFTSSGTEANNIVINSLTHNNYNILTSATEHKSVLEPIKHAAKHEVINVQPNGTLDLSELERAITQFKKHSDKVAISVMYANNETGIIHPFKEIYALTQKYECILHTDISQALTRIPLSFYEIKADYITFSGHKIGAMTGTGCLIFGNRMPIQKIMYGGEQEYGVRPGTQNSIGIVTLEIALQNISQKVQQMDTNVRILRNKIEKKLLEYSTSLDISRIFLVGNKAERIPNTSCIGITGVDNNTQAIILDMMKCSVGIGAACSSGITEASHVLLAMKYSLEEAKSTIRISLGRKNTDAEIETFINSWKSMYSKVTS